MQELFVPQIAHLRIPYQGATVNAGFAFKLSGRAVYPLNAVFPLHFVTKLVIWGLHGPRNVTKSCPKILDDFLSELFSWFDMVTVPYSFL